MRRAVDVKANPFRDGVATTDANVGSDSLHRAQPMLPQTRLRTTTRSLFLTDRQLALRPCHDLMAKLLLTTRQRLRAEAETTP